jgi:hypothetical protein
MKGRAMKRGRDEPQGDQMAGGDAAGDQVVG